VHGEKWAVPWQILDAIEQASRMRCNDGSLHRPCGFYKQDNLMPCGNSQINVHVFLLRKKIRTFLNFVRMRERAGVVCRKGEKEKRVAWEILKFTVCTNQRHALKSYTEHKSVWNKTIKCSLIHHCQEFFTTQLRILLSADKQATPTIIYTTALCAFNNCLQGFSSCKHQDQPRCMLLYILCQF